MNEANSFMSDKLEKQLKAIKASIQKKYGADSITYFGCDDVIDIPRFTTGCRSLDRALTGGFPEGRIIELFGPASSGKSTTCLHAIASMQQKYPEIPVAYIDSENSMDLRYARALGVNTNSLMISQPDTGQLAFDIIIDLIEAGIKLIIIDSVAALLPKEEDEASLMDNQMGVQARMMSKGLRKINTYAGKAGCTLLFTNQTRLKIGVVYGNPTTTPGGQALPFYASVRLEFRPMTINTNAADDKVSRRTKVVVVKNKVGVPFKECEFDIKFGKGFDESDMIIDEMFTCGIATKKGSWMALFGENVGQGRETIVEIVNAYKALDFFNESISALDAKTTTIEALKVKWEAIKMANPRTDIPVIENSEVPVDEVQAAKQAMKELKKKNAAAAAASAESTGEV